MPFTVGEVENIANSTLDFFVDKGRAESQHIQDKPLLKADAAAETTFPGGKEFISGAVKGNTTSVHPGFPARRRGRLHQPGEHEALQLSLEADPSRHRVLDARVAKDGISIVDTTNGKGETEHSERELTALVNILNEKFEDMAEGWDRGFNNMYWGDGSRTQPGPRHPLVHRRHADGRSRRRRHRSVGQHLVAQPRVARLDASTPATVVTTKLQKEYRQLRRYGGNPKLWIAGSDFIEALEKELRSKGTSRRTASCPRARPTPAWPTSRSRAMGSSTTRRSTTSACPSVPLRHGHPLHQAAVMDGEDKKKHYPARPENKYMFYRAMTWMGGLDLQQA
jgi:hypothetical protein